MVRCAHGDFIDGGGAMISTHSAQEQQQHAQTYHSHHFQCPQCIAAGIGYGQRCGVGLNLWAAYLEAS